MPAEVSAGAKALTTWQEVATYLLTTTSKQAQTAWNQQLTTRGSHTQHHLVPHRPWREGPQAQPSTVFETSA